MRKDALTQDLFEVPEVFVPSNGNWDFRLEVSHEVSEALKSAPQDRYEVAAQLSRLTGREVSKHMLDAYAGPARDDHNLPLAIAPVLEEVIASHRLTDWLVTKRGGKATYGKETLQAELGRLTAMKDQVDRQMRQLKKLMGDLG
jgi:hypothetical protein